MKNANRCKRIKFYSVTGLILLALTFGTLALAQDIDRNGNWYNQPQWEKGTAFVEFPEGISTYASFRASSMEPDYVDAVCRRGNWYNRPDMEKGTAFAEFPEGSSDYSSSRTPSWEAEPSNVLRRGGSWYNRPIREKGTAFAEFPASEGYVAAKPAPEVKKLVPTPTPEAPVAAAPPEPPKPTPKPTEVPAPEVKAPLDKIYFDYDKSDLRGKSKEVLNAISEYLKQKPSAKVKITGHTDNIGSHAYNDPLSIQRSTAAKNYLVDSLGIPALRISIDGKGKREPATTNETPEGRQLNRRCEFEFSK